MGYDHLQHPTAESNNSRPMQSSYDRLVGNLIVKSRIVSGLPPLTNQELAVHIRAWSEILNGVVPESRLEESYQRAVREHGEGFAIAVSEIVKGFRGICDSERVNRGQNYNKLTGQVCPKCKGTNVEEVTNRHG